MTREEAIEYAEKKNLKLEEEIERPGSYYGAYAMHSTELEFVSMAISALRQRDVTDTNVGKWISVKDRLPDYMGEVLVIVSGKPHENITLDGAYEIAEYDPVEGWILEMWPEWCSGVVTHWMPLPEPPEEGTV